MPVARRRPSPRLTESDAYDHGIAWEPDGKKLVFVSDRDGQDDLYLLESDDPDSTDIAKAHRFKVKRLTETPEAESEATFSPDGKRIAYLKSGQLWTMKADGTDAKAVVKDVQVFDYDWSPDSKYIAFARNDGSYASEIYIVPSAGGEAKNVTHYATYNGDITWSKAGKRLGFVGQHRGGHFYHVLRLQKPAMPSIFPGPDVDWDDIQDRVSRPAPLTADAGTVSPDGHRVALRSTATNDLWVATTDGKQMIRVTNGGQGPRQMRWSKNSGTVYFLDGSGTIRVANVAVPSPSDPAKVSFSARFTVRRDEEFREMFAQSWRLLAEHFYDPAFHGANWTAVRAKYAGLVRHVALKEDLYALISLMLGELNASHLGIFGPSTPPEEMTADLGLLFDDSYRGPGLKVSEILKHGPADKRGLPLHAAT